MGRICHPKRACACCKICWCGFGQSAPHWETHHQTSLKDHKYVISYYLCIYFRIVSNLVIILSIKIIWCNMLNSGFSCQSKLWTVPLCYIWTKARSKHDGFKCQYRTRWKCSVLIYLCAVDLCLFTCNRHARHLFLVSLAISSGWSWMSHKCLFREKAEMSPKGVLPNTIIANYYILYHIISYYIILLHI